MEQYLNDQEVLKDYHDRSIYDSNCFESWAPINNLSIPNIRENTYWVSTFGRVWSCNTNDFIHFSVKHKPGKEKGYYQAGFLTNDGKRITRAIHRIVMITFSYFLGCENLEVDHINDNSFDNRIINLRWATGKENVNYAHEHCLHNDIPDEVVIDIINMAKNGMRDEEITERLGNRWSRSSIKGARSGSNEFNMARLNRLGLTPVIYKDGEYNHKAISDESLAVQIHNEAKTATKSELINKYGISKSTVMAIRNCTGAYSYLQTKYHLSPLKLQ